MRSSRPSSLIRNADGGIALANPTLANQAQFYQKTEGYGVAIASSSKDGNDTISLQISAPVSYGWAAVGTGRRMNNALMFIIYPSGLDDGQCHDRSVATHTSPLTSRSRTHLEC